MTRAAVGPQHQASLRELVERHAAIRKAASGPRRIQWSRYGGVKLPAGARLVDRTSRFGNPFRVTKYGQDEALRLHRLWLLGDPAAVAQAHADGWPAHWPYGAELVDLIRANLAGYDLCCTGCGPADRCHADLLLIVAATGQVPDQDGNGTEKDITGDAP